jgi:hypothetical protein
MIRCSNSPAGTGSYFPLLFLVLHCQAATLNQFSPLLPDENNRPPPMGSVDPIGSVKFLKSISVFHSAACSR